MQTKKTNVGEAHKTALFPKRGDHYAKQDWKKHGNKEQDTTAQNAP